MYHYIITHNYSTELKNHLNKIFGIFENTDIETREDQQDQLEKKQRIELLEDNFEKFKSESKTIQINETTEETEESSSDTDSEDSDQDMAQPIKINPNTPVYSGKFNENLAEWLFIAQNSLDNAVVDPDKRVQAITGFLRGNALQHVIAKQKSTANRYAWTDLETDFKKLFRSNDFEHNIRQQLSKLKMSGNFTHYVERFQNPVNQLTETEMPENERRSLFIGGLDKEYAHEVLRTKSCVDLNTSIETATTFNQIFHTSNNNASVNMHKKVNSAVGYKKINNV